MAFAIVSDEWLFHDLSGQNGDDKQEEALRFLVRLAQKKDRLVILEGSPFQEKVFELKKASEHNADLRRISKSLDLNIISNASVAHLLAQEDIKPMPSHLAKLVPREGDHYLFQAHLEVKGSFIVTTDKGWKASVYKRKDLDIRFRDDFLPQYLQ